MVTKLPGHILETEAISLDTKMKIYKCAVGSLFTYGSEAWDLSSSCLAKLNGANAANLHRFTGKTRVEESRSATCTYNLCDDVRRRRLVWLGHILRMDNKRLVYKAARVQHESGSGGNLFLDAPTHKSFDELVKLACVRKYWKAYVKGYCFSAAPKRTRKTARIKALTRKRHTF